MSRADEQIRESILKACINIRSTRVNERKNGIETLISFIEETDSIYVQFLDRVSYDGGTRDGPTWTSVFLTTTEHFEKDNEKITVMGNPSKSSFYAVERVFQQGNQRRTYIALKEVFKFIVSRLNDPPFAIHYCSSLLNLLNIALKNEVYTSAMTAKHWKGLIDLFLKLYEETSLHASFISRKQVLELLTISVMFASKFSSLISYLRKIVLDFYAGALSSDMNEKSYNSVLLKSATSFCQNNALEFREMLCKFGEDVIPSILNQNIIAEDEDSPIIGFLLVQLSLHHPCDLGRKSEGFYAANVELWQDILESILTYTYDLLGDVAAKRCVNLLKNGLLILAAKVTFHVSEGGNDQNDEERPRKKRMLNRSFNSIVEDAAKYSPEIKLVWCLYFTEVLTSFPSVVSENTLNLLFEIGISLIGSREHKSGDLSLFLRSLVLAEGHFLKNSQISRRSSAWQNIFDSALKVLPETNDKVEWTLFIRQILIDVKPKNLLGLLHLYTESRLKSSQESVTLLVNFLQVSSLPETIVSLRGASETPLSSRNALIEWACEGVEPGIDLKLLARLLSALTLQRLHDLLRTEDFNSILSGQNSVPEKFESQILNLVSIRLPLSETKISEHQTLPNSFQVVDGTCETLIKALTKDLETLLNPERNCSLMEILKRIELLLPRLFLILHLGTIVELKEIGTPRFGGELEALLNSVLDQMINAIEIFISKNGENSPAHSMMFCSLLEKLLKVDSIANSLSTIYFGRIGRTVNSLWKIFKRGLQSTASPCLPHGEGGLDIWEGSTIKALKGLFAYASRVDTGGDLIVRDILEFIHPTNSELTLPFAISNEFLFVIGSEILKSSIPFLTNRSLIYSWTRVIQDLCRKYHTSSKCTGILWSLLNTFAANLNGGEEMKTDRMRFFVLVGTLYNEMKNGWIENFEAGLECLGSVVGVDPTFSWSCFRPKGAEEMVYPLTKTENELKNPSLRVRMAAAKEILSVLTWREGIETEWGRGSKRMKFYAEVIKGLQDTFNVPSGLTDEEVMQEGLNRTRVVLFSLARIVWGSSALEEKALFSFCLLVKLKGIDFEIASHALAAAGPEPSPSLNHHIPYLLHKWLRLSYNIEGFPHQFFGCKNHFEFCSTFKKELVVEFFQLRNNEELENLSRTLKIPINNLIKKSYGMLMARMAPGLSSQVDERISSPVKDRESANECYNRLLKIVNSQAGENLGHLCLPELILYVIEWGGGSENFEEGPVLILLEFLKSSSKTCWRGASLVGELAICDPGGLYNILLALAKKVESPCNNVYRLNALKHFTFFVRLILDDPNVLGTVRELLGQSVLFTMFRFLDVGIKIRNEEFLIRTLNVLHTFVIGLNRHAEDELILHLGPLLSALTKVWINVKSLRMHVDKTLQFILIDNVGEFGQYLALLDPFPPELECYESMRIVLKEPMSLKEEIQLAVKEGKNRILSLERLTLLSNLLGEKKLEMNILVSSLQGKRFADEVADDPIHSLVQLLVKTIKDCRDNQIVTEACRCLGEIGPIDMSVLVLPSEGRGGPLTSEGMLEWILNYLVQCLMSSEFADFELASQVLESCFVFINKKLSPRLNGLLKPFKRGKTQKILTNSISLEILETQLGSCQVDEFIPYKDWILKLSKVFINCLSPRGCSFMESLLPLCIIKTDFCKQILPFLVYNVLYVGSKSSLVRKHVSNYFTNFFSKFCQRIENASSSRNSIYLNKTALSSLLGVVQYLRCQKSLMQQSNPWDNNFLLDVNYFQLAEAAQFCGAYLTSILYTEIYALKMETEEQQSDESCLDETFVYSQIDTGLYPKTRVDALKIQKLLLKAYVNIGDVDGIDGCGLAQFFDFQSNINHLEHKGEWGRVLSLYENQSCDVGVAGTLNRLGLHSALFTYLAGLLDSETNLPDSYYESALRLSKWDLHKDRADFIDDPAQIGPELFHKFLFKSVKASVQLDPMAIKSNILKGYESLMVEIREGNVESSENLYGFLGRLQALRYTEEFLTSPSQDILKLLKKWEEWDKVNVSGFKYIEETLSLRTSLFQSFGKGRFEISRGELLLKLVKESRDVGLFDYADRCVNLLPVSFSVQKKLEIAMNHWGRGETSIAKHFLRGLIETTEDSVELYPHLLLTFGEWQFQTESEPTSTILDKYLKKACGIYEEKDVSNDAENVANANIVVAKCADQQYQKICEYINSASFQEKIEHHEKAKSELHNSVTATDIDTKRSRHILTKTSSIDEGEIQATLREKNTLLLLALRHYHKGLNRSNLHDLHVFRAISLWFEQFTYPDNAADVNGVVAEEPLLPYKYVLVFHQLTARISNSQDGFTSLLSKIIMECTKAHPFHTLPILLTQAYLMKDKEINKSVQKEARTEERVKAAEGVLAKLKKDNKLTRTIVQLERLWIGLITLANVDAKNANYASDGSKKIPDSIFKRYFEGLETVPIPTVTTPVLQNGGNYDHYLIGIKQFRPTYGLVGGINAPKKINCVGTNGVKYNMLLKGNDDIRQDAVMQQVFGVMNQLLAKDTTFKDRQLNIRTYKVVPLSQVSGILEWVENTMTFGEWLIGPNNITGAHVTYRPNDMNAQLCRKKMMAVKDCRDNAKKTEAFIDICDKFKPVFRHFFFESFKDAGTFFERKLAYTRSVASSSMVGYILGLGDRHVQNILIDKETAEVIHIDLGVAFEQGKILPTPETIPFRLTRDVVDGMGVAGVEGVFRRSCEMTMEVLRRNSSTILTILEVLLYDPLYMWTLTSDKKKKVQPPENGKSRRVIKSLEEVMTTQAAGQERNNSAARVLLRLKSKLSGMEEGTGSSLSVSGQVSILIKMAMDIERMSRLFSGWQPYL